MAYSGARWRGSSPTRITVRWPLTMTLHCWSSASRWSSPTPSNPSAYPLTPTSSLRACPAGSQAGALSEKEVLCRNWWFCVELWSFFFFFSFFHFFEVHGFPCCLIIHTQVWAFHEHIPQGTWLLMETGLLLRGSNLHMFSIHLHSFHHMFPTFGLKWTKQQHVRCFLPKCLPQICKQHRQNTQPTTLDTEPRWLACRHFLATKCQRKGNAVVYGHLDGEQRNKKYITGWERGRRRKKRNIKLIL